MTKAVGGEEGPTLSHQKQMVSINIYINLKFSQVWLFYVLVFHIPPKCPSSLIYLDNVAIENKCDKPDYIIIIIIIIVYLCYCHQLTQVNITSIVQNEQTLIFTSNTTCNIYRTFAELFRWIIKKIHPYQRKTFLKDNF